MVLPTFYGVYIMNIFYLSENAYAAAMMHCDKHVVKMNIEYAQMLSTAHRVLDGTQYTELSKNNRKIKRWAHPDLDYDERLMKATHVNHPSNVWVRSNRANYRWTYNLYDQLLCEYKLRYKKTHACARLKDLLKTQPENIPVGEFYAPPLAMPEEFKVEGDPITSYRNLYKGPKRSFAKWFRDEAQGPAWFYS